MQNAINKVRSMRVRISEVAGRGMPDLLPVGAQTSYVEGYKVGYRCRAIGTVSRFHATVLKLKGKDSSDELSVEWLRPWKIVYHTEKGLERITMETSASYASGVLDAINKS